MVLGSRALVSSIKVGTDIGVLASPMHSNVPWKFPLVDLLRSCNHLCAGNLTFAGFVYNVYP